MVNVSISRMMSSHTFFLSHEKESFVLFRNSGWPRQDPFQQRYHVALVAPHHQVIHDESDDRLLKLAEKVANAEMHHSEREMLPSCSSPVVGSSATSIRQAGLPDNPHAAWKEPNTHKPQSCDDTHQDLSPSTAISLHHCAVGGQGNEWDAATGSTVSMTPPPTPRERSSPHQNALSLPSDLQDDSLSSSESAMRQDDAMTLLVDAHSYYANHSSQALPLETNRCFNKKQCFFSTKSSPVPKSRQLKLLPTTIWSKQSGTTRPRHHHAHAYTELQDATTKHSSSPVETDDPVCIEAPDTWYVAVPPPAPLTKASRTMTMVWYDTTVVSSETEYMDSSA